jgi:hypothetical protein
VIQNNALVISKTADAYTVKAIVDLLVEKFNIVAVSRNSRGRILLIEATRDEIKRLCELDSVNTNHAVRKDQYGLTQKDCKTPRQN